MILLTMSYVGAIDVNISPEPNTAEEEGDEYCDTNIEKAQTIMDEQKIRQPQVIFLLPSAPLHVLGACRFLM